MTESVKFTRGHGILENFLARKRALMAEKLIPARCRGGRILDIGCGTHPLFLLNTDFYEKHGLDKIIRRSLDSEIEKQNIKIKNYDIESKTTIPYPNEYFDIVTMLAVLEHIDPHQVIINLKEIHRILKPEGILILTIPAGWTDGLLKTMAKMKIVSADEINEHKDVYNHPKIRSILQETGFNKENIRSGYFELFMNLWVRVNK